jgi:hypothetical protein
MQEMVASKDCVEAANPSLARKTRFHLLAQRGIGRKYGHTVDSLCGNPLCICDEHVIYRPWKALTKPTKWGEYANKVAALKVGKSFEIADYPHNQTEISKLRGGIGGNRVARFCAVFLAARESGSQRAELGNRGTLDDETMTQWFRVTHQVADSEGIWVRGRRFRSAPAFQRCGQPL